LELYNLHRALATSPEQPLVIVEGFFSCMHLWQAGIRRAVAVMGSSLSPNQAERILDAVGPADRIVLMFDEDDAGRHGSRQAYDRLARRSKVTVVSLEQEGAQPDSLEPKVLHRLIQAKGVVQC